MISEEQYELWESQFRNELYPSSSSQESIDSDEETNDEKTEAIPANANESNYFFNDSDDEDLEKAAEIFKYQFTPVKNSVDCDVSESHKACIADSDDDSPVVKPSKSKIINRQLFTSPSTEEKEYSTSKIHSRVSKSSLSDSYDTSNDLMSEVSSDSVVLTQENPDVIHWQSFQEGSQNYPDLEVEGEDEDFDVVSEWATETQLDKKILKNKYAQKDIRKRSKKKANPFLNDEADDAYDHEECFNNDHDIDTQQLHDTSLVDFITDHDHTVEGEPTGFHLRSLMSQNPHFQVPQMFQRKAPAGDISILSDTDEENFDDQENEYSEEDSFVCDDIVYVDDETPKKIYQTQQMRLRSKRLVERKKNHETPDKPLTKKRRRVIIESP